MSKTSLLQHIRQTAQDRKDRRGTMNANATVPPEQPSEIDPTASSLGGWRAAPYFQDAECRFENLAPLESTRRRQLALLDRAAMDDEALRDDFAAAADRVYGGPKPAPRRPTTPRR